MRPAYQKYAVEVHASPIDGQGAFAAEAIPARRKIGEIRGESISVDEARIRATRHERIMIVELSAKKAIDFSKSSDPMRYTNHSCRPNAQLVIANGRVEFFSLSGHRRRRRDHGRLRRDPPRRHPALPLRGAGLPGVRSRAILALQTSDIGQVEYGR